MKNKDDEEWEKLGISNDFIFSKLMQDKETCKTVLEVLLGFEVSDIRYIENEKTINIEDHSKSVRLDIYVEDGKRIYNVEMQVVNRKNLMKRCRYYQAIIDLNSLKKGESYTSLKDSYIIFICTFDPFGRGLPKYTHETYCVEDLTRENQDGMHKVYFNCKAYEKEENPLIKTFLKYVNGKKDQNSFIDMLDGRIEEIKDNKERRKEYMALLMRERIIAEENYEKGILLGIEKGREEGIEKGIKKGRAEGIEKGIKKGREEGILESIPKQVEMLKELDIDEAIIIEKMTKMYNITEEEVKKYLKVVV